MKYPNRKALTSIVPIAIYTTYFTKDIFLNVFFIASFSFCTSCNSFDCSSSIGFTSTDIALLNTFCVASLCAVRSCFISDISALKLLILLSSLVTTSVRTCAIISFESLCAILFFNVERKILKSHTHSSTSVDCLHYNFDRFSGYFSHICRQRHFSKVHPPIY